MIPIVIGVAALILVLWIDAMNTFRPTPKEARRANAALNLQHYTVAEIDAAHKVQQKEYGWTLSSERQFMETLFGQRFNFLLIVYSLFISAAAATPVARLRLGVLIAGSLVTSAVAVTIWRAYVKMIINIRMLYRIDDHPLTMVNLETEKLSGQALVPVNFIIAFWIPVLCVVSLAAGALLTSYGFFDVPPR